MNRRVVFVSSTHPLIQADRALAESLFGRHVGRPTISRHVARKVARITGMSIGASLDFVHLGLLLFVVPKLLEHLTRRP